MGDNLNPISSKGRLSFAAFAASLLSIVVINLMAFVLIRSRLIPARVALEEEKALVLYGAWFAFSALGFLIVTNLFLKRWKSILDLENLPTWLNTVIRIGLLSPLFAYPALFVTFLFFPGSPIQTVENGQAKRSILALLFVSFLLSVMISLFLPRAMFGVDRIFFRESTEAYSQYGFKNEFNPIPSDRVFRPFMSAVPPATRYLSWLAVDFLRVKSLSVAIEAAPEILCAEKMGFVGVEVADCFFWQMRKMANRAPLVSPLFGFYFESSYRQAHPLKIEMEEGMFVRTFATSMVTISNQLELIEMGPLFVSRVELLKPTALLHAFASPEIPIVEAGQDIQRYMLQKKILPIIEMQMDAIKQHLETSADRLGEHELAIVREFREMQGRVAKIKRDPLMVAQ